MRELRPLTPDRVPDLVGACAPCTFWQTVPRNGHRETADPQGLLAEWVAQVTSEWAPPGRIAYVDEHPMGHVILAPAGQVSRLATFPTAPGDPSTLILVTVCTADARHDGRLRKALVQAAVKDALRARVRSLEAIGARPLAVGRHTCVLEVGFLERVGFHVERDHLTYPRLRMDLRSVVTLKDEATERIARALVRLPGARHVPTHPGGATRARSTR
ncbi:MAG: N-acetyltransferase [Micrococcales bacterium]|nr:N-acetyltransferase [Micrococcales bacterium]